MLSLRIVIPVGTRRLKICSTEAAGRGRLEPTAEHHNKEPIDYDGNGGNVSITCGASGFRSLAAELARKTEAVAA